MTASLSAVIRSTSEVALQAQAVDDVSDNNWLDQFRIPVGEWFTQIVDWVDANLGWLLEAIQWPFQILFDLLMSENPSRDSIMSVSWVWVVLGFFLLGSVLRNTRIGLMAAAMVTVCGFLGQEFWFETSKTFGMVFVAVFLCTLIGLPLGILCGRNDAVWNVTRPILDAMQVIHSFVWMLPFIAFWGIGEVSGTMVTMMFAMPPMVRLTNLGIRQVPEDVVEAARSFGASERRVLTDVQIPLARPAIMTGLNQTLLLAISMLGIVALMGAGGLGWLMFRAINNLDVGLAASAGLAFFLVAVVLDRISQPEEDDGLSLFSRIGQAWRYRAKPEEMMAAQAANIEAAEEVAEPSERPFPVESRERMGLMIALVGSAVAIVGALLPWVSDAGPASAWGRVADENLAGEALSGISASGGSFFGIFVVVLSLLAIGAAARPLFPAKLDGVSTLLNRLQGYGLIALGGLMALIFVLNLLDVNFEVFQNIALIIFATVVALVALDTWIRGTRRLGADGVFYTALAAFGTAIGFLFIQAPAEVSSFSLESGLYLAIAGGLVATVGGGLALISAPYMSERPLPASKGILPSLGAGFAVLLVVIGSISAWVVDEREGFRNREFFKGMAEDGPGLGWPTLVFAILALIAALWLNGIFGLQDQKRWHWGALTAGLALPVILIPLSFTMTISRSGDTDYFNDQNALTGAGILFAISGGFILFSIGLSAMLHFARRKIYSGVGASASTAILLNDEAGIASAADSEDNVLEGSNL